MSKKKLTDQQQKRILENQELKIKQTENDNNTAIGQVIKVQRKSAFIKLNNQIIKVNIRKTLSSIVCGDKVVYEQTDSGENVISAVLPRNSILARSTRYQKQKLIAANIDLVIIVLALTPEPSYEFLDRSLLACESNNINTLILLNKIDMQNSIGNSAEILTTLQEYKKIGYSLLEISTKTGVGMQQLSDLLQDKLSTFIGHSGVGKSSISQILIPDQEIQIGKISDNALGKHTTSVSYLYDLKQSGQIIDTPGIRDFVLGEYDLAELEKGYIEFNQFLGLCKYHNCTHIIEPNCAIKQALADKHISQARYDSFCKLFQTVSEQKKSY